MSNLTHSLAGTVAVEDSCRPANPQPVQYGDKPKHELQGAGPFRPAERAGGARDWGFYST